MFSTVVRRTPCIKSHSINHTIGKTPSPSISRICDGSAPDVSTLRLLAAPSRHARKNHRPVKKPCASNHPIKPLITHASFLHATKSDDNQHFCMLTPLSLKNIPGGAAGQRPVGGGRQPPAVPTPNPYINKCRKPCVTSTRTANRKPGSSPARSAAKIKRWWGGASLRRSRL